MNYADWCSPINSASKRPHHILESAEDFSDKQIHGLKKHINGMLKRLLIKTGFVSSVVNTVTGLRAGRSELRFPVGTKYFLFFITCCAVAPRGLSQG